MKLPFFNKKEKKINYFCLYITDTDLSGFVLDINEGIEKILSSRTIKLTKGLESLLEDTDSLISELELATNSQLDKTIFFLHSTMIDVQTHDIKEPYKTTIKNISRDLELEPMGYIDVKETVEDYLKHKAIINAIILELNKPEIGIFIYKGGALVQSKYIPRTETITSDLTNGFAALPGNTILPTRIVIYGDSPDSKAITDIAQFNWDTKLFSQHPAIETLKDTELYKVLANSFAHELGAQPAEDAESVSVEQQAAAAGATFGFVVGSDVARNPQAVATQQEELEDSAKPLHGVNLGSKLKENMGSMLSNVSLPSMKGLQGNVAVIGAGALVLVGALFFGYEYFFHKVTLDVTVKSKEVSEEIALTLPVSETKTTKLAVMKHGTVLGVKDEKTTTGTRDIGEKAKGEVVIHNFDNSERSIQRGTKITYKSLTYVLDSDVKVASSSGVTSDGTKQSGKTKVDVTASDIGSEYNIDKGTQLSIDSLAESLFIAIADSSFTGGSKKKVNTVSKQDIDTLQAKAEKTAEKSLADKLKKEVAKDEILIPGLTKTTVADANYSKEVGEEAQKIAIEASSEMEYYTVSKAGITKELQGKIGKKDANGYKLSPESIRFSIEDIDNETEEVTLSLNTTADLFKEIDKSSIVEAVKFKQFSDISNILTGKFEIEDATVKNVFPSIPFISGWVPLFAKNITVTTSVK
jgi:hypothetical protein